MNRMEKIDLFNLEKFSLRNLTKEEKVLLLKELGFDSDGIYVLNETGQQVQDKYVGWPIKVENMLILPGSTILLDDNELSVAMYLKEYGDDF